MNHTTEFAVSINGETRKVPSGSTVSSLLEMLEQTGPAVAVEVNGQLVPSSEHADFRLPENSLIEVVTLSGGG